MPQERRISRRGFLRVSAIAALGAALQACAQPTPQVVEKEVPVEKVVKETVVVEKQVPVEKTVKETVVVEKEKVVEKVVTATPVPAKYKEAPVLAELVKAGKLPPVDERLPVEPLVLTPVEKIGKYGGKWTFMSVATTWSGGAVCMANWCENFMRFERDLSGHRPNVVSKWVWNATGTEITLYFRKGMKWSDGAPATVDDWLFWWNDMINDEKVKLPRQTGTHTAGEPMKVDRIDDYTLKLTFTKPNPLFVEMMNRGTGARATSWQFVPSHYLKQFHYKYTPSVTDTTALLDHYNNRCDYPDMPHHGPWIVKDVKAGEYIRMTRNPYYWKVDTEGNQLPYIDDFECKAAKDVQLITLSCVAGEIDFQMREMPIKDIAVLKENAAKGGYRVDLWKNGDCNSCGILFHYCNPDKTLADLMWQQKFRIAMSVAINRERINDIVFLGLGRPRQIAMLADGPEFKSERGQKVLKAWEETYSEYDPEKAKRLLDEIGVKDVNNDGWREKPDGSPLDMIIDIASNLPMEVEGQQLIKEDFAKVGLKWTLNVIDPTLLDQRVTNCESAFRSRGGSASGLFIAPSHWAPVEATDYTIGGRPYGLWYQSGGKDGIEPPSPQGDWMKKLMEIYTDALTIVDVAKRHDRTLDGYQVHIDEGPFQIGTVGDTLGPVVVKNTLKNVISSGIIGSWVFGFPGTADPEQWFQDI